MKKTYRTILVFITVLAYARIIVWLFSYLDGSDFFRVLPSLLMIAAVNTALVHKFVEPSSGSCLSPEASDDKLEN